MSHNQISIQQLQRLGLLIASLLFTACSEQKLEPESVIRHNSNHNKSTSELDKWIYNTWTKTYNTEIIYRWQRHSTEGNTYAYPPREDKIRAVLSTLQALWLPLYEHPQTGGANFLKGKMPLRIYLFGGKHLDSRGFELIAGAKASTAEMFIYNVNDFDPKDPNKVFILLRSILHQFSLRLMELTSPDRDAFAGITPELYISSTNELRKVVQHLPTARALYELEPYALTRSFITLHAMLSPESDQAELASSIITHTPRAIAQAVARASIPEADNDPEQAKRNAERAKHMGKMLEQKKQFVEHYYTQRLGLSLPRLQQRYLHLSRDFFNAQP